MPKRSSNNGRKCAASSKLRSKPAAMSGHAAHAAAIAATAATPVASQPDRLLLQNATLALPALPNGITSSGSAAISNMACHLFSRPRTHQPAPHATLPERPRDPGAASDHDQDHERKDDKTGRDELAAQNPRMHGDAAGECECKSCHQRDAPVAHDEANKGGKNQHATGCDQPSENTSGARGAGHGGIECRGIGCRRNAGQRIAVEQAESVQQLKPELQRQDGYIRGVIEEQLQLADVEDKGVV